MILPFPSPTVPAADHREVFLGYLDYFRESIVAKVGALPEPELRRSRLPSGWTPLELVMHLRHVERRWIEWGFQGRVGRRGPGNAGAGAVCTWCRSTGATWGTWTSWRRWPADRSASEAADGADRRSGLRAG